MINCFVAPALSVALLQLKNLVAKNEELGKETVIFCEDRIALVAERTVCSAVGGTFLTSVCSFSRFLSVERGAKERVLSSQGSAMVIRKIIEDNAPKLKLFKKLYASSAAQSVYDTIAVLYSSKVSAAELLAVKTPNSLLNDKLADVAFLYGEYENYLQQNGLLDRNTYLKLLPPTIENSQKIKGKSVILLGFQAFTSTTAECVRSIMATAGAVDGIFIGGIEDIYTNEAIPCFCGVANQFGGAKTQILNSNLCPDAEHLRQNLFNPERYNLAQAKKADSVHIFEATDEGEELEFIAASIKKHVISNGERYAKISVMLPDLKKSQVVLERVFGQYKIPYYIDRRFSLAEHSLANFVCDYLLCATDGCLQESVNSVISSPQFALPRQKKEQFKNYILRLAHFRGGVLKEPKREIVESCGFNFDDVVLVQSAFIHGLNLIKNAISSNQIVLGVKELLSYFKVEQNLLDVHEKYKDVYPIKAQFAAKAYKAVISVLEEAQSITSGLKISAKEFVKIVKSGFSSCEISLIPPKADAVFIGDIASTVNSGSNVVFAAGLTEAVPLTGADTALLTDREILVLEQNLLQVSPKISQVNLRSRETVALNICAFKKALYLSYPTRTDGQENGVSEIILYAKKLFLSGKDKNLDAITQKALDSSVRALPYYCSEVLPAAKQLAKRQGEQTGSAIYNALSDCQQEDLATAVICGERQIQNIKYGKELFLGAYNSISPSTLESYFACPYQNFLKQGLRLLEREEGGLRAVDAGNFIHAVLETVAPQLNDVKGESEVKVLTEQTAQNLLLTPEYASLTDTKSGKYTAQELIVEATTISLGAYEQIKNSHFKVAETEKSCTIKLDNNLQLFGVIDRVDKSDDMVRIVDYKTGLFDASATKYYMGVKLQLPLYLSAVSKNLRPVGAYYFPAAVTFKSKEDDGVFRLEGFMDASDEVMEKTDTLVLPKQKSKFVSAYYKGRNVDNALSQQDFADFICYSTLIARQGANEMMQGNVVPSPVKDQCDYCKMGGSCSFYNGAVREIKTLKGEDIAKIVKKHRGDE